MLRERVATQSEVIRTIFLEDSPCCEAPHQIRVIQCGKSNQKTKRFETNHPGPFRST